MTAHIHEPVKPLRAHRQDVPEELDRLLERMVAKQTADRFATPSELADVLRPFAAGCDLRRLAAQARGEAVPPEPDAARLATDVYRTSGVAETESKPRPSPRAVWSFRDRIFRRSVATALALFGFVAFGIIFYLRDGQQTVKVEIDSALVKDAMVTVWLDGREMEVIRK